MINKIKTNSSVSTLSYYKDYNIIIAGLNSGFVEIYAVSPLLTLYGFFQINTNAILEIMHL